MIVVSSPKPSADSHACALNQWRANASWQKAFDQIVYVGEEETTLKGHWIWSAQFPTIQQLLDVCVAQPGWSAIVNADIYVPIQWRMVEAMLLVRKARACVSRRWQFEGENLKDIAVVDLGIDFFAAHQSIWQEVQREFHHSLRIGHDTWDSHMLGILNAKARNDFWDITPCRVVLHPKHGDRKRAYEIDSKLPGYRPIWPVRSLKIYYEPPKPTNDTPQLGISA